jgi:hypothetical protein
MMIARFSVLAVCVVLSTILGVSQSANLRGENEVVSEAAEEAALMFNLTEEFEKERSLQGQNFVVGCSGQEWGITVDKYLPSPFKNKSIWGTCATMHPCLCGCDAVSFAIMCPSRCRLSCGGKCATDWSGECPNGFAVDKNGIKRTLPKPMNAPNNYAWPANLGSYCPIYNHAGKVNP